MPIDAPIHTNEGNLPRVLKAGLPLLLVFWRRDCAPCDQFNATIERLARAYAGRALIVKINVADEPNLAGNYHIQGLPSTVFIKDGQTLATALGAASEQDLKAWLEYLTGHGPQPAVPTGPNEPLPAAQPQPAAQPRAGAAGTAPGTPPGDGSGHPIVLTDENFDQVLRSTQVPVLVDFWAVWCGPCKIVAPTVEQLAREYAGRAVVGKVNVDENPDISGRYGIMSIPTLMIFRNGKVVDQLVGAQPPQVLRQALARQVR